MSSFQLYNDVTALSSQQTTLMYSSSFSSAIKLLHKDLRQPIYDIYGFVRFADEIVDTFHDFDKKVLFDQFKKDTYTALEQGISLNPILHRFQLTYRQYNIDPALLEAFLYSMEMDLSQHAHDEDVGVVVPAKPRVCTPRTAIFSPAFGCRHPRHPDDAPCCAWSCALPSSAGSSAA